MSTAPERFGSSFYRGLLPAAEQELYDAMLTCFEGGDYSGKLRLRTGESEAVFRAYSALRDDHPELFWLGGQCAFTPQTGDMRCAVLYTPDQIGRIRYQLRRCLFQLVRGTAGLPPVEREILVYERIARRLTYINNGDVRDHNIVGPVLLSAGVCEDTAGRSCGSKASRCTATSHGISRRAARCALPISTAPTARLRATTGTLDAPVSPSAVRSAGTTTRSP